MLLFRPIVADPVSDQHVVATRFNAVVNQLVSVVEVDNECDCVWFVQPVTMDANPRGGCQLRVDAMVFERDFVVSSVP